MALNWHLAPFWKASSFPTNNSTMKKIAFLSLGSSEARVCPRAQTQPRWFRGMWAMWCHHQQQPVECIPHPRDPGALWRKNSRLPHWVLRAWMAEIQSCCWSSISKWFSLPPSTKVIVCDIWFWTFTLHICNFSSYFQTVIDIKTAIKM